MREVCGCPGARRWRAEPFAGSLPGRQELMLLGRVLAHQCHRGVSEIPLSVTVSVSPRFRPAERGVWVTARCAWPASRHARAPKHKLCHKPPATSTMPEPHGPWLLAWALWQHHVYEYCVTVRAFFCQALSKPWKPELSPRWLGSFSSPDT